MKKLSIIVAMVFVGVVNAQQLKGFGVKGGANFSNIVYDNEAKLDLKYGFYIGALYEYKFNSEFSIQPEILYSNQGAKIKVEDTSSKAFEIDLKTNYITLPILVKYYPLDNLYLLAGPNIGIKTDFSWDSDTDIPKVKNKIEYKEVNSFDLSISLGVGYKLTDNFGVEARFNRSATKLFKAGGYNVVGQLGAYYQF